MPAQLHVDIDVHVQIISTLPKLWKWTSRTSSWYTYLFILHQFNL